MRDLNRFLNSQLLVPALLLGVIVLQIATLARNKSTALRDQISNPSEPSEAAAAREHRSSDEGVQKLVADLRQQVSELSLKLDQQNSVLHRSLGKSIPIEVPKQVREQFKRLEERLAQPATWPKSAKEAELLRQELDQLVKQHLPPWAEEEFLPHLNPLRWGVRCLWLVRQNENADGSQVTGIAEELRSLLAVAPDNAPQQLKQFVEQQRQRFQKRTDEYAVRAARVRADQALAGKGDLVEAAQSLEGLSAEGLDQLRGRLQTRILDKDTARKEAVLRATLQAVPKLPTDRLQQTGLLKVQDAAASLLLDLHTESPIRPEAIRIIQALVDECDKQVRKLGRQQQEAQEQRLHNYQKWAIDQIQAFDGEDGWYYDLTLPWIVRQLQSFKNADQNVEKWALFDVFPSTKNLLQEKLGIDLSGVKGASLTAEQQHAIYQKANAKIGWNANIDQEIAYRTTRDGMIKFLLPINVGLLDPPVAQLYQKAFQKAWSKLEGRPDQLEVAKQSAVVPKRSLE
jgi:hypothetical protein